MLILIAIHTAMIGRVPQRSAQWEAISIDLQATRSMKLHIFYMRPRLARIGFWMRHRPHLVVPR